VGEATKWHKQEVLEGEGITKATLPGIILIMQSRIEGVMVKVLTLGRPRQLVREL